MFELSAMFLVTVINIPRHFLMTSSSRCIDVSTQSSTLASPLPPSFLGTYSLTTSSLRCKTLCIITCFLVWSIGLSSSLFHFKNGSEYLTKRFAKAFIPNMRFLLYRLVSSSLSFSKNILFKIFFFLLHLFDGVRFQYFQVFPSFFFCKHSDFVLVV